MYSKNNIFLLSSFSINNLVNDCIFFTKIIINYPQIISNKFSLIKNIFSNYFKYIFIFLYFLLIIFNLFLFFIYLFLFNYFMHKFIYFLLQKLKPWFQINSNLYILIFLNFFLHYISFYSPDKK